MMTEGMQEHVVSKCYYLGGPVVNGLNNGMQQQQQRT